MLWYEQNVLSIYILVDFFFNMYALFQVFFSISRIVPPLYEKNISIVYLQGFSLMRMEDFDFVFLGGGMQHLLRKEFII